MQYEHILKRVFLSSLCHPVGGFFVQGAQLEARTNLVEVHKVMLHIKTLGLMVSDKKLFHVFLA